VLPAQRVQQEQLALLELQVQQVLQVLLVQQNAGSREQLAAQFEQDVTALDPQGTWRTAMAEKTEAALNRLGNLRSRSLVLEAPNRIGMLRDILSVLADHGIDMTALDSQLLEGDRRVRFEIGIGSAEIDTASLTLDLTKHETEMLR
jgi:glycine cleavage system regulatory protein